MPVRELLGKSLTFLLVAGSVGAGGGLVLHGSVSGSDSYYIVLGYALLGLGVMTLAYGVFVIGAIYYDARLRRREGALHITPRSGPPAPPPAWGMGDVGRPSVIEVGRDIPSGGGSTRVMSVVVSGI